MARASIIASVCLCSCGCTLRLPEIPPTHPANAGAASGQMYATPAVLEVTPIVRPPDYPSSQPMRDHNDSAGGDGHNNEMQVDSDTHEHESQEETTGQEAGAKSQQQMQKEGQLHDHHE